MTNARTYTISEIEAMTESEVKAIAAEQMKIKEHDVYFVDLSGAFGYSAIVFCDGMQIYHANDYQLHHTGKKPEELKQIYFDGLNRKLFTESELLTPSADYSEQNRKEYFLMNYYGMRKPHISQYHYCRTQEEREAIQRQIKEMIYNPVCLAYYYDPDFVEKCVEIFQKLVYTEETKKDNFEYWVSAFKYEMANHEYQINWQGDYDVISVFASVDNVKDYENPESLMIAADFTDTQKKAYYTARRDYLRTAKY